MVMNKLWKTRKRAPTLVEMAFLCVRTGRCVKVDLKNVKQPPDGGTSPHKPRGTTSFLSV
jgi:hypothetical protein